MKKENVINSVKIIIFLMVICGTIIANEKESIKETNEYKIVVTKDKERTTISTQGKAGYHCNTLYPWKLTVLGNKGEKSLKKENATDFSERKVTFIVLKEDGKNATLKLSVCNDKQCIMKTEKFSL